MVPRGVVLSANPRSQGATSGVMPEAFGKRQNHSHRNQVVAGLRGGVGSVTLR